MGIRFSAQGPRAITANQIGKLLEDNPKRLNLTTQNFGAGRVILKKNGPPTSNTDGFLVAVNATVFDGPPDKDVHLGEWWFREIDGLATTLYVIEN